MGFWKKILGQETIQNVQSKTLSVSEADRMLKRTNELANIANKTTDRDEFYRSIDEIKSILRELAKYEGKLPFIGSPSADLRNLERIEKKQIEFLEKRIEEKEKMQDNFETDSENQDVKDEGEQIKKANHSKVLQGKENYKVKNEELDTFDCYIADAGRFIIEKDMASIGMIQRVFKIGFNRACRIMDKLEEMEVIGEETGTRPRKILVTRDEYEEIVENYHPKNIDHKIEESGSEKLELYYTPMNAEIILLGKLGIKADYSKDGESLSNLKNIIIPSASNETQIEFINTLLMYNSPETMRLILIDDSIINYSAYDGVPQLLIPIVTDGKKIDAVVSWCSSELEDRIRRFVEYGVKNIDSFNEKRAEKGEKSFQRIICIVNEAKEFFDRISKPLERLFMNSNMVGIYFILFSRFSLKGLSLGIIGELLEICTANEFRLLVQNGNTNGEQSISRNFDDMEGHQFEYFCADVLRKNGFEKVEVTQGSGDQGIDIIAFKDGIKYGIQCKCYSADIGNKAVQEAFSGKTFYNCHVGVVLTNRYFTASAKELAEKNGILLWDRNKLNEMIGNT